MYVNVFVYLARLAVRILLTSYLARLSFWQETTLIPLNLNISNNDAAEEAAKKKNNE